MKTEAPKNIADGQHRALPEGINKRRNGGSTINVDPHDTCRLLFVGLLVPFVYLVCLCCLFV